MKPWLITHVVGSIASVLFGVAIGMSTIKPDWVIMLGLGAGFFVGMWLAKDELTVLIPAAFAGVFWGLPQQGLFILWGVVAAFFAIISMADLKMNGVRPKRFLVLAGAVAAVHFTCLSFALFASFVVLSLSAICLLVATAVLFYFQLWRSRRQKTQASKPKWRNESGRRQF